MKQIINSGNNPTKFESTLLDHNSYAYPRRAYVLLFRKHRPNLKTSVASAVKTVIDEIINLFKIRVTIEEEEDDWELAPEFSVVNIHSP